MKRLILITSILIGSYLIGNSQDYSADQLPAMSGFSGTSSEYFYLLDGAVDKHFTGLMLTTLINDSVGGLRQTLIDSLDDIRDDMNLLFSGEGYFIKRTGYYYSYSRTLVPKDGSNYLGLWLGADPGSAWTQYTFYNYGESYFNSVVTFNQPLYFDDTDVIIYRSGDSLKIKDWSGTYNLLDLAAFPATLTANTIVNTSTYDLSFVDGSGYGYFRDYSEGITKVSAPTELQLEATDITLTGDVSLVGGMTFSEDISLIPADTFRTATVNKIWGSSSGIIFETAHGDYSQSESVIIGYDEYSGGNKSTLRTPMLTIYRSDDVPSVIPEEGTLRFDDSESMYKYVNGNGYWSTLDTTGGAGGAGFGSYDSTQVWSASKQYIVVVDPTMTYFDTVALEIDSSDAVYCATLTISSANILAGDSLQIVAAPGAGKIIVPVKVSAFLDYGGTAYSSTTTSYIKTKGGGTARNIWSLENAFFQATADGYHWDQPSGDYLEKLTVNTPFDSNTSYWLDLDDAITTGNGIVKIKLYYTIADFN